MNYLVERFFKLSGMKKVYSYEEERFLQAVTKMNRSRGFYLPKDKKGVYKDHLIFDKYHCLIVQNRQQHAKRAILYFFGDGNVSACGFSSGGMLAMGIALHNNVLGQNAGKECQRSQVCERRFAVEKINITGVPETMLQTLYARAAYSQRPEHKFYDAKAIEIVSRMNYDFTKTGKDTLMSNGVIARTILLDRLVGEFVCENPDGTVVNIACGLDMRCYRLDNDKIRWYNLDLPETIEIRRRFVQEDGRFSMIAKSAMDESWTDGIETNGKTLVVIEGLTMYLSESDVRKILSIIVSKFERVEIIMETMSPFVVKHVKEKSIDAAQAKFTWGVKCGKEVERLVPELRWIKDVSLAEGMVQMMPSYKLVAWIPAIRNISNKLAILEGRT